MSAGKSGDINPNDDGGGWTIVGSKNKPKNKANKANKASNGNRDQRTGQMGGNGGPNGQKRNFNQGHPVGNRPVGVGRGRRAVGVGRGAPRPVGPATASFDQGSHFLPFNPQVARENQQDWDQVVLHGRGGGHGKGGGRGGPMIKERKWSDHRTVDESRHLRKVEEESESFHHKRVSKDLSQKIINYRASHHLTQKQLAAQMNLPLSVVQEYERGTAIVNGRVSGQFHKLINKGT